MRIKIHHRLLCLWMLTTIIFLFPAGLFAEGVEDHIVKSEEGYYYIIQKGDTLWDLSEKFSDTPWQWPDLWKENEQIKNPHLIYPGQKIRLLHRAWDDVPPVTAVEATPQEELPYYMYAGIDMVGFIRDPAVSPAGELFKVKGEKGLISENDLLFISKSEGVSFLQGERYVIYRPMLVPKDEQTEKSPGTRHLLLGIVEITRIEEEFVLARVERSFRSILMGDKIMPFQPRSSKIIIKEGIEGMTGKIIMSEENNVVFGQGDTVFIDKGTRDGIEVGQVYFVYEYDERKVKPADKTNTTMTPLLIGNFIVLHTEETTSTIELMETEKDLDPGSVFSSELD